MCGKLIRWVLCATILVLAGQASAALPPGWSDLDIGTSGGSANETGGRWTVTGDGADIWGTSDAFHFAYVPLSGDGQIVARVIMNGTGSNSWAKGGVMVRETLSPGSKHAMMIVTGGSGGGVHFQWRVTTGGSSSSGPDASPSVGPPRWVKILREGDRISGFHSWDGVNWRQQGDTRTIRMANNVYVGLCVTSHAVGEPRTYTFDKVSTDEPKIAVKPDPPDGAAHQGTWVSLSWSPGSTAASHNVYFGESRTEVDDGAEGTFRANQSQTAFLVGLPGCPYPDGLALNTTYYWRIDEVEADGLTKHKGRVWSFLASSNKPDPSAVPTFHCIGLYWSPQDGRSSNVAQVRYRPQGSTAWKEALPLWYDNREINGYSPGYRGSIVNLNPGTVYEIKLKLLSTGTEEELTAKTWSEDFPIAKTVYLPTRMTNQTFRITESGSPDGYILYTAPDGGSIIDADHSQNYCITVEASYVIVRGLNLRGAKEYGIRLYDCHDVVIERCDISDWSSIEDDGWGNRGSAIFSLSKKLKRIIIQRNKMHHPYSDTNSWTEYRAKYSSYHPRGPRPLGFADSEGNHVIRYNEIYSDDDHYFDDCIGSGNSNFPNRDSDIYGNYIANCWDDGIEAEDDNCNVRIWGNFIEWNFVKIAVAPTSVGPVYVWRNVAGVARQDNIQPWNDVSRGGFLKTDDGGGKIYVFHNTVLQPEQPRGVSYPLGCGRGLGWGGRMLNTMSRNNVLHVSNPKYPSIKDSTGVTYHDPLGDYDYDLYNGPNEVYSGAEPHGIRGVPIYNPGNGDGQFSLDLRSPGYDAGAVIPNFNDNYAGGAPDVGACEAGSPPMQFGVNAYQQN